MRTLMRRRRGQGMTEYTILVGLIAILLVGAVERYKEQIRVTIVGSGDKMEKDMDGPATWGSPAAGTTHTDKKGKTWRFDGKNWVLT